MLTMLLQKKLFCCGTIRQTQKYFPEEELVNDRQLKMGKSSNVMSGDIGLSKWKDRGKKCMCCKHYAQSIQYIARSQDNQEWHKRASPLSRIHPRL